MFVLAVSGSLIAQMFVIFFPPLQSVFQTEALHLKGSTKIDKNFQFSFFLEIYAKIFFQILFF